MFGQYRRRFIEEAVETLQQAESEDEWRRALLAVGGRCTNEAVRLMPEPTADELDAVPF